MIEKDRVLGMQSDGLGEIEVFYLFQSHSSYLFESFYYQHGNEILPTRYALDEIISFICLTKAKFPGFSKFSPLLIIQSDQATAYFVHNSIV